jgi:hypothetical protein
MLAGMTGSHRKVGSTSRRRLLSALCVALVAILVAAPAAFGQSAGGQYDPSLDPGGIVQGSTGNGNAGQNNAEESNGGAVPFTGYPLTPLIAIVGMLFVGGLAIRLIAPSADRKRL